MRPLQRIVLCTDFGSTGPYTGQLRILFNAALPNWPLLELVSDLEPFHPTLAAYLLPALLRDLPTGNLVVCVVDPGVGSARTAMALEADGNWYVAPDNGSLALIARRATRYQWWRIDWRPEQLSASFHGRDLFAPLAVQIACGQAIPGTPVPGETVVGGEWPDDLPQIIYCDHYGNLLTGLRAHTLHANTRIHAGGRELCYARVFSEVPMGAAFWYANAFGLVELAVNQGRAAQVLKLRPGAAVATKTVHT